MNKEETKKIIGLIACAYPTWSPKVKMDMLIDSWTALLGDMSYEELSRNLTRYIQSDTSGFAPSIGELRSMSTTDYPTELEAWATVRKAIKNSGYHYNEEFAKLSDILKKAVGSPNNLYQWSQIDSETLGTVEQSHFISVYKSVVAQAKNDEAVRGDLKKSIAIPQAPKEEPLAIETEKPTASQEKVQALIQRLKDELNA